MSYWSEANPGTQLVHTAYALDRLGPSGLGLRAEPEPQHPFEIAMAANNALIIALLGAEKARRYADSYRQFLVGAAAVAYFYGPRGRRSLNFAHGANVKPIQGSDIINVHAEQMVMAGIQASKAPDESVYVPVMAVVGDLQPDQQSGEETLTLHPCGVCRDAFDQSDTPVDKRTLFVTANPDFTVVEWFSLVALAKVHNGDGYQGIGRARFEQRSPILTPVDLTDRTSIALSEFDTPEMDRAEFEYEEKVMFPVRQYVINMTSGQL